TEAEHIDHGQDCPQAGASGAGLYVADRAVRQPRELAELLLGQASLFACCANRSADLGGEVLTCGHSGKILPKSSILGPARDARQSFGKMLPMKQEHGSSRRWTAERDCSAGRILPTAVGRG